MDVNLNPLEHAVLVSLYVHGPQEQADILDSIYHLENNSDVRVLSFDIDGWEQIGEAIGSLLSKSLIGLKNDFYRYGITGKGLLHLNKGDSENEIHVLDRSNNGDRRGSPGASGTERGAGGSGPDMPHSRRGNRTINRQALKSPRRNMNCAYCGLPCVYPRDFPVPSYAKCKNCVELEEKRKQRSWIRTAYSLQIHFRIGVYFALGFVPLPVSLDFWYTTNDDD